MAKATHITSETHECRGVCGRTTRRQNDTTLLQRLKKKKTMRWNFFGRNCENHSVFEEIVLLCFRKYPSFAWVSKTHDGVSAFVFYVHPRYAHKLRTVCIENGPHCFGSPRTELTGARPLENSSEYDFSGRGSSSAYAGATASIPAPATPARGNAVPPIKTAGVRIAANAIFASVCFIDDALPVGA